MDNYNGKKLWKSPSVVRIVYSDASSSDFAGYTIEYGTHGLSTKSEKTKSSICGESQQQWQGY